MQTRITEWNDSGSFEVERPSPEFIRAVAALLETSAEDVLAEMGYVPREAVINRTDPIPV